MEALQAEQVEVQEWEQEAHRWVQACQAESVLEARALLAPQALAPTRTGRIRWAQQALVRIRKTVETRTSRREPQACRHRALPSIPVIPMREAVVQAVPPLKITDETRRGREGIG